MNDEIEVIIEEPEQGPSTNFYDGLKKAVLEAKSHISANKSGLTDGSIKALKKEFQVFEGSMTGVKKLLFQSRSFLIRVYEV